MVCTEVAIFKVESQHIDQVIEISKSVIDEMNADEVVVLDYSIKLKTDDPNTICWLLTWKDEQAAHVSAKQWKNLPSSAALEVLVQQELYYGYFR